MSCYGLGTDEPSFPREYKRNGFDEDGNSIFNIPLMFENVTGDNDEGSQPRYPASPT